MTKISLPKSLYKYCTEHGANIVRDLMLKVTPPNEFNDPFEFSPFLEKPTTPAHIRDVLTSTSRRELYDEMVRHGEKLPPFELFLDKIEEFGPTLEIHGGPAFDLGYWEMVSGQLNSVSETSGVICLSEAENQPLMWSHYTNGHKGMVVEFDTSLDYFQQNSRFMRVNYGRTRVPFDPNLADDSPELDNFPQRVLTTKHHFWDYESEWRSLFPLSWCEKKVVNGHSLYFTHIPPALIKSVILGCRCSDEIFNTLIEARTLNGMSFTTYRAVLHKSEFGLVYAEI